MFVKMHGLKAMWICVTLFSLLIRNNSLFIPHSHIARDISVKGNAVSAGSSYLSLHGITFTALLQTSRRSEAVNSAVSKVNYGLYLTDLGLTFLSTFFSQKKKKKKA